MKFKAKYLLNGGLLLLVTMLWNIIFYNKLPEVFSFENFTSGVPNYLLTLENIFRYLTFAFTILIVVELKTKLQKNWDDNLYSWSDYLFYFVEYINVCSRELFS